MQSSSRGNYQGYQGYPYVNPIVNDIPSIDAATASRWANLPRRPIVLPGKGQPGSSGAGNSSQDQLPHSSGHYRPPKRDIDPVVYIDLPEAGSEVSQSIETPGSDEPEFVQDTIMYDPFENRRIDSPKDDSTKSGASSTSGSFRSTVYTPNFNYNRPNPPNTLNLASPGGSSSTQSPANSRPLPNIPVYMTKESAVYGGDGVDGFPMSPIPISEFPPPPPAYTEVATSLEQAQAQTPSEPIDEPPPRTQVIVNGQVSSTVNSPVPVNNAAPINSPYAANNPMPMYGNLDRKNMICQHCGVRVHTLVIKEIGFYTHIIACIMIFIFFPLILIVYFSECFRQKNHYCPNCNRLIGYVIPIVGEKVNYANS